MNRKVLLIIPALALSVACSKTKSEAHAATTAAPEPTTVAIQQAEVRKLDRSISVTGSLNADEQVTIAPEVQGRVKAIYVDFGQPVKKGQVVAEIDPTEYQIQLERARASLNQSLARLGLKPGEENQPPESTAAMRQARAQLEDARFKYESAAKLVKSGDVSQERFTELEKQYQLRKAAVEATQDDVRTQWMGMEGLRAEVKLAQKRLNDCTLRAPFDGSVQQKQVSPGQYIRENTAILTIVKSWPLRLRLEVPETAAATVKAGTRLAFNTSSAPGVDFHAVVSELNPALDARNRSLTAEARIQENDARLRPGMFVQVRVITQPNAETVVVPRRAMYTVAGLTKVFVVRNGRAIEQRVPPSRDLDGWAEVPPGTVNPGEQVAISNLPQLVNGAVVKVQSK